MIKLRRRSFMVVHLTVAIICSSIFGCAKQASSNEKKDNTAQQKQSSIQQTMPLSMSSVTFHAPPKLLSTEAITQDWHAFFGPDRNAVSIETKLLKHWPIDGPALVWEMTTGSGYAAPVVQKDKLIFFHRIGDEEIVECMYAETGKHFWKFSYPSNYKDRYEFSNGPRSTPVIDGDRVYTYGVEGKLYCLNLETGSIRWHHDPSTQYNIPQEFFGQGSSPLIYKNLLIVNVGAPGGPTAIAYDKISGDVVWKVGKEWRAGYASPMVTTVNGQPRILIFAGGDSDPPTGGLLSIDPKNGLIESRFYFRSKQYISINAATPVVQGNEVFLTSSYRTGGVLLSLPQSGDPKILWRTRDLQSHFTTPLLKDGYLYGFDGSGKESTDLVCLDWKTGKLMWREHPAWEIVVENPDRNRINKVGLYRGNLLAADGHFLALGEEGHLVWLDLTPEGYKEISRTRLFKASQTWTPPTLSRGLLYITQHKIISRSKSNGRLLCYDLRDH